MGIASLLSYKNDSLSNKKSHKLKIYDLFASLQSCPRILS